MNYGLYTAFLGMRARQRTLETIANNIANASTSGFKGDRLFHHSIEEAEATTLRGVTSAVAGSSAATTPTDATGSTFSPTSATSNASAFANPTDAIERAFGMMSGGLTDFSVGVFRETGRPLDVALEGDGFLVVQTPRGERYTRAGALTVDSAGQLVTQRGELVVGSSGPITLQQGRGDVSIGADGTVAVGSQQVGQLKVVRFNDNRAALTKESDTLFMATGKEQPQETTNTRIAQGVLEMSNINAVGEMAMMMHNSREFDSLQRSITLLMNDIGRKVASEIGRI